MHSKGPCKNHAMFFTRFQTWNGHPEADQHMTQTPNHLVFLSIQNSHLCFWTSNSFPSQFIPNIFHINSNNMTFCWFTPNQSQLSFTPSGLPPQRTGVPVSATTPGLSRIRIVAATCSWSFTWTWMDFSWKHDETGSLLRICLLGYW